MGSGLSTNVFLSDDDIPGSFRCPITLDLLRDPVILGATGHTFERKSIESWLERSGTDPLTNQRLANNERNLIPNLALRDAIEDFLQRISGRIIASDEIKLGDKLGTGAEKEVFEGLMKGKKVAVLRVRQAALTSTEARMFVRLGCHPHLVRFIGRARIDVGSVNGSANTSTSSSTGPLSSEPNALIVELAPLGDLASYLSSLVESSHVAAQQPCPSADSQSSGGVTGSGPLATPSPLSPLSVSSPNYQSLSQTQSVTGLSLVHRLLIAEQIADGMTAVHSSGIIHRDLAARNIMVFSVSLDDPSQTLVKVSDYGLAAATGSDGYLQTGGTTRAPIRWMPPETIKRRTWSLQSDIWAFGVVVWEIFTDGEFPYGVIGSDQDVAVKVCDGSLRLTKPDSCPADVWSLVERCWAEQRDKRPPFTELRAGLQQLRAHHSPASLQASTSSLAARHRLAVDTSTGGPETNALATSTSIDSLDNDMAAATVAGKGVITYDNGDVYTGELRGGRRHGKGRLVFANGDVYDGDWARDVRSGSGALSTGTGIFTGEFRGDKMVGSGRIVYSNGDVYEGDWRDGVRHGVGKFTAASTMAVNNNSSSHIDGANSHTTGGRGGQTLPSPPAATAESATATATTTAATTTTAGAAVVAVSDSDVVVSYDGSWLVDKMSGLGTCVYRNGDRYEGTFAAGVRCGPGRLSEASGSVCEGEWLRDKMSGTGQRKYVSGDVFKGLFREGLRHGKGCLKYANNNVLEAEWVDDVRAVRGKVTYANGDVYDGQLAPSERSCVRAGTGRLVLANGDVYEGGFADDLYHGLGEYKSVSGQSRKCQWIDGKPQGGGPCCIS